jgi:glycerol uptake facilitator-like aquaporin
VTESIGRRVAVEAIATAFLLSTIVGSGIAASKFADGNIAIALLANSLATGAILTVLILIFGPVSGAHMNPVVSAAAAITGTLPRRDLLPYVTAQLIGAAAGVFVAHLMFGLPALQVASTVRSGPAQWLSEGVATFGLLITVFGCSARAPASTPFAVGLYIVAAFWFTASTSFANPAVTFARSLTDTLAGIAPASVVPFMLSQIAGALLAIGLSRLLWSAATDQP